MCWIMLGVLISISSRKYLGFGWIIMLINVNNFPMLVNKSPQQDVKVTECLEKLDKLEANLYKIIAFIANEEQRNARN